MLGRDADAGVAKIGPTVQGQADGAVGDTLTSLDGAAAP